MTSFKYSGRIAEGDPVHSMAEVAPDGALIAPHQVSTTWGSVPQYAPTVQGTSVAYDPAGNCDGYFMSSKYQPNNNCYAYGCNIATNSFPQPGRRSGAPSLANDFTAEHVTNNAISDGLVYVGDTMGDVHDHATSVGGVGHYVALMFSPPGSAIGGDQTANWPGDYHWARCDDLASSSWSQKDGGDQVTDFDFAGQPITDPSTANWRVNQGPIGDQNEYVVSYGFHCFMYVPPTGVDII